MAERDEGEAGLADDMLSAQVTLDALSQSQPVGDKVLSEEMDASILNNILEMEGTATELKEDESSIMEALAECGEVLEEADEDYEEGDEEEEGDSDEDEDDDEDDDEDEEEEASGEEEVAGKSLEEALDFGEMPDFSSMMEAEGASVLEGTVAADLDIKTEPDEDLMDIDAAEKNRAGNEAGDQKEDDKRTSKQVKRKRSGKEKAKKSKKTKKEKKKRKKKSDQDSKVDSKSLKVSERRRNIRKIIREKDLEKETLDAQKEEFERQQRLMELKRQAMSSMAAASSSKSATVSGGTGSGATSASAGAKVQDPQLKSLLQSAEEEAKKIDKREKKVEHKPELIPPSEIKKEVPDEVEEEKEKPSKVDVIELSSDSESNDDDCVMVPSSDEEDREQQVEEAEDLNDGGAHINDEMNSRDEEGRVLVNVGHPAEDPDIFLAPQMARAIKPHQIGGVRFLYDNLVESLPRFENSQGFGCILAHSMGLGKTIQVISFIDIFLRHTGAKKVLCIVPINTLQNWMAEFNMWDPAEHQPPPPQPPPKAKDKKAEKKPRERSKKNKEANSKSGGKGSKGKGAPSAECGQNLMGDTALGVGPGILGPPASAGSGGGQGGNMLGVPGMCPMGNVGGGNLTSVGVNQGHMGGNAMDPMRNTGLGPIAGPSVGQNSPLDSWGNNVQGMNVSAMGNSGGSFQEMPWMNSPMAQPFGFAQHNPGMRMSTSPNQSAMSSASFPGTDFRFCSSNSKDFAPFGNPVTSFTNSPSVGTMNSSGYLTDISSPVASNTLGSAGSLMEADGWNRTDNSLSGSCPNSLMDAASDSASVGSFLGMSCGSPMSRLSSNSALNGPETPHNVNSEQLVTKLAVDGGLERFMGPSSAEGSGGNMDVGMGLGMVSSSGPLLSGGGNRMDTSPCGIPSSVKSPFMQASAGSPLTVNPANGPSSSVCAPSLSSSANVFEETAKGSPSDAPCPQNAVMASPSANTEISKNTGELNRAEDEGQSGAVKEGGNTAEEGPANSVKDTENEEVKAGSNDAAGTEEKEVRYRNFKVFLLNDSCKATAQRAKIIGDWNEEGGVLLMGYEMYRLLSNRRSYIVQPKKRSRAKNCKQKPDVIDVDEEDKNKELLIDIHGALVNPGPDLVICDEGHRIKNNHASISQALKQIRTRRRVVLTGYPLQNNLMEYWCMVDFVRPNFLGNRTEFSNMFERPIMNGQCQDSTNQDRKLMKQRAYVLHSLLQGFVQRRSHVVLQRALPRKHEYVFLVRMSPIQRKLYRRYIDSLEDNASLLQASTNPLKAFSVGCKIWNHPDILHKSIVLKKPMVEDNDLEIEGGEGSGSKKKLTKTDSSSSLASMASSVSTVTMKSSASSMGLSSLNLDASSPGSSKTGVPTPDGEADRDAGSLGGVSTVGTATSTEGGTNTPVVDKKEDDHAWVGDAFEDYEAGQLEHGPKMVLLNAIIEEALAVGDKILVFSQSLSTLDTMEEFLSKSKVPRPDLDENWAKNRSYFRLDGSTSGLERERLINEFNRPDNKTVWVFLLSTKAGCLGINLIGANRAVVLDASWNPCHDCQAVCRVFRFGQTKECHIYRLVTENTLERNIYDRQITKQGMSDRVVDEINSENPFSRRQLQNLLKNEDQDFPYVDFSQCEEQYDDPVIIKALKKQGQWITKEPFTHESLLIDRKELRMTLKEKRQAREGYARDKRMNVTYSRPSYAAYYPRGSGPPQMYIRRTPQHLGGIRPMMSTPPPRHGPTVIKPGVSVQQVITTTDIVLPGTNTATDSGSVETTNKISAGQKILVIKTPKGVYIRTNDGKMFAVRSKGGEEENSSNEELSPVSGSVIGGISTTTTTTSTTVSSGGRGGLSTPQHPSYLMGRSGMDRDRMDQASFSMSAASRHIRNMYPMDSRFHPAMRARGMRPMIRPSFVPSGRGRSRPGSAGKPVREMGFPYSDGLPPRRGLRGRGQVMPPFRTGVPPMHSSTAPPYLPGVSKGQSSAAIHAFSKRPDLSGSSHMMKLLSSEEEGDKVGRSTSVQSGFADKLSTGGDGLNPDAFTGYTSVQDRPGKDGTDSGGEMEDDSDMDSDPDLDHDGDAEIRRKMAGFRRDMEETEREDVRRGMEGREMASIRRSMERGEVDQIAQHVDNRRELAEMAKRKAMEDIRRQMEDIRRDTENKRDMDRGLAERREVEGRETDDSGRQAEEREMEDARGDVERKEMEDTRRDLERGEVEDTKRDAERREVEDMRRDVDSRREMEDVTRNLDGRREVKKDMDKRKAMEDIQRQMEQIRREMEERKGKGSRREMADSARVMESMRGMSGVGRNVGSRREMLDNRREMFGNQDGENSRDMEGDGDMGDSGDMNDDSAPPSSPESYPDDMMEDLLDAGHTGHPFPPEGWDMEDQDFSSGSSSSSSFSQHMGMALPPENSIPSTSSHTLSSQGSSHSSTAPRRHFNMAAGKDRQSMNRPNNPASFRDRELIRGQPGAHGVRDSSVMHRSQPSQSLVRGSQPTQSMVRSPQPPQSMVRSPQPPQSMVRSPQPPQSMVQSPQPPQSVVRSPHTPQSMLHSPVPHSPSSPHSPSPGPSSQRTGPAVSRQSQLPGNSQSIPLGDKACHPVSSPLTEPVSGSQTLPQSASMAATSSFMALPTQQGQHYAGTGSLPPWQSVQRGSHHQSHSGQGRAQGRQTSYLQSNPSAAQMGPQRTSGWADPSHVSSPAQGSQSLQQADSEGQVTHMARPPMEGSMSSFSGSQGESPMSEEWMNSPGWFDEEGSLGQADDQRQGEGDPANAAVPQSLSGGLRLEDFSLGGDDIARFLPACTPVPPPPPPPPPHWSPPGFGPPALVLATNQASTKRWKKAGRPRVRESGGPTPTPSPQNSPFISSSAVALPGESMPGATPPLDSVSYSQTGLDYDPGVSHRRGALTHHTFPSGAQIGKELQGGYIPGRQSSWDAAGRKGLSHPAWGPNGYRAQHTNRRAKRPGTGGNANTHSSSAFHTRGRTDGNPQGRDTVRGHGADVGETGSVRPKSSCDNTQGLVGSRLRGTGPSGDNFDMAVSGGSGSRGPPVPAVPPHLSRQDMIRWQTASPGRSSAGARRK